MSNTTGAVFTKGDKVERIDNYRRGGTIICVDLDEHRSRPFLVSWTDHKMPAEEWHDADMLDHKADSPAPLREGDEGYTYEGQLGPDFDRWLAADRAKVRAETIRPIVFEALDNLTGEEVAELLPAYYAEGERARADALAEAPSVGA